MQRAKGPEGRRILVIDDEPAIGRVVARLLREHTVEVMTEPEGALTSLLAGEEFDVVLCDVTMPGLGGPELHRRLEQARPEQAARFVFLTGGVIDAPTNEYLDAQEVPAVLKPFRSADLRAAVAALL